MYIVRVDILLPEPVVMEHVFTNILFILAVLLQTFKTVDEHGYFFWMYYYSLVVIGTFFMLNLVLGVLSG